MDNGAPLFVGITGGTCSGKTTLEGHLQRRLGDALAVIPFDDMAIGRTALQAAGTVVTDWDDPGLFRWDELRLHLHELRAGRPTLLDARSRESRASGITTRRVEPRPIVALIGYLALHDRAVARSFGVRIFIDLPEAELVRRRRTRAPADENREPYTSTTLLPAHRRLVAPQRAIATHVLDGRLTPETLADSVADIIGAHRRRHLDARR
jgi:uridine kinase